jgi:hypothetical protein
VLEASFCLFEHNSCGISGAAFNTHATVAASVTDCTVVGNRAQEAGGGLFTNSYAAPALNVRGTAFAGNEAHCCYAAAGTPVLGSQQQFHGSAACADVDSGDLANCCLRSEYSDGQVCRPCPDQYDCGTLGITAATLSLKPGLWRANFTGTLLARKCWMPEACAGKVAAGLPDDYCAPGYTGPCESSLLLLLSLLLLKQCSLIYPAIAA